jgi:hypothetical protein
MHVVIFLTAAVPSPVSILSRVSVVHASYNTVHNVTHFLVNEEVIAPAGLQRQRKKFDSFRGL